MKETTKYWAVKRKHHIQVKFLHPHIITETDFYAAKVSISLMANFCVPYCSFFIKPKAVQLVS